MLLELYQNLTVGAIMGLVFLKFYDVLASSADTLLSIEERKEKQKEAEVRAKFVQELVLSTLVPKK